MFFGLLHLNPELGDTGNELSKHISEIVTLSFIRTFFI